MKATEDDRKRRFDTLFASYSSDIVAYCRWRTVSPSDAQDAAADVFLTAWRRLDELPAGDAARVCGCTRRRAGCSRINVAQVAAAPLSWSGWRRKEQPPWRDPPSEEHALVHDALHRLPVRDREVLLLAEWEGLSPTEIAAVVGCLTVRARGRLHRARRRFRAVFEELLSNESRHATSAFLRDAEESET